MYYPEQQSYQQYGRMFQPSFMQQQMMKPSVVRGRIAAANNKYSKVYERALQDKVKQLLIQQQQQQQADPNVTKHTPSSASISSSISTLELIQYVLREYEQETPLTMQPPTAAKSSYTIYEDLKIIFSLSQENNITSGSFKRLSDEGIVTRTPESVKSRYQDFLKNLTKDDYQNILSFIESNGLRGYLVFEKNNENVRMLHAISKTDPKLLQGENGNKISTPLRSPRLGNGDQDQSRPRSPMFPPNPYGNNGFNQPFPFYPQYPMYPPQMFAPHMQSSPSRQNQQFYDYGMQQYPQMYMNPYFMNPYGMYPPMQQQQQQRFGNDEEQGEQIYQVRPSAKKANIRPRESNEEEELEEKAANFSKKRKLNESTVKSNVALNTTKKQQVSEKQQQPQQAQQLQQQQQQKYPQLDRNSLNSSRNNNNNNINSKVQATLVIPKQASGLQVQKPTFNPNSYIENQLLAPSSSHGNKALTKEVYDLISDEDRVPECQFDEMMGYIAQQVKLSKEKLVDYLDQLSGSFKDFNVFLETKQENMLWTKDEDLILEGLKTMDSSEFKLLSKLKGISSIKKRIIYNSLNLPFVVV